MHLTDAIVPSTIAAFLNHSVSEGVDSIGKFEIAGSAIRGSMNSRYLAKP
jgi:hypothetical protein